mmetsp:Transcript_7557/g.14396  ORF Transcript_7557/g.14396 Transcript_7557/m.14396 type:complete len:203 (+) Transcript_7557:126-734(+)
MFVGARSPRFGGTPLFCRRLNDGAAAAGAAAAAAAAAAACADDPPAVGMSHGTCDVTRGLAGRVATGTCRKGASAIGPAVAAPERPRTTGFMLRGLAVWMIRVSSLGSTALGPGARAASRVVELEGPGCNVHHSCDAVGIDECCALPSLSVTTTGRASWVAAAAAAGMMLLRAGWMYVLRRGNSGEGGGESFLSPFACGRHC